jgi:Domain of unknown function (DUF4382)
MNVRTRAAAYGLAGLALASIVIFSGSTLGVLQSYENFNPLSSGVLSILLTDPPSVPDGVSAIYINYTDIAIHVTGFGDSGWVTTGGQGSIETFGLVNLSQTISTGSVPAGRYNLVRFTISAATVEYQGKNYSANVYSGKLTVPIVGGLAVNASHPAAAVVDIHPTVLNLGSQADPNFVITSGARALQVPAREVTALLEHVGNRLSLNGRGWFQSFLATHSDNLTGSGATLTSNSFSFSTTNPGPDQVTLRMIIVSQTTLGVRPLSALGLLANSVVFTVGPDRSLHLVTGTPGQVLSAIEGDGYSLQAGASVTLAYSGSLTTLRSGGGITAGSTYYIILVGSRALSVQTVEAS